MMFLVLITTHVILLSSSLALLTNASTLPSNALNRWINKDPLSLSVRGGEGGIAVRNTSSSRPTTSKPRLLIDDPTSTSLAPKAKKRRKKKSSTSSTSTYRAPASSSSSSSSSEAGAAKSVTSSTQNSNQPATTTTTTTTTRTTPPPSSSKASLENTSETTLSTPKSAAAAATTTTGTTTPSHDQMPSIFQPEESIYDKYAACLAATEGLRRIRDSKIPKNKPFRTAVNVDAERSSGWKSFLKGDSSSAGSTAATGSTTAVAGKGGDEIKDKANLSMEQQKEEYKRACAEYVLHSSKVVKALGLSVSQFNQLGREIRKNKPLKEKVMEQAYLYRMASTIKMDKIPLIEDPNSKKLLQSHKRRRVQMFVKSITEIEDLRSEQMDRLTRALNIDKIPPHMNLCDPNVLPLLSPQVRTVIEAFPLQAEVIVKKYGLNSDEFNQMLEETRGNPIFRWRVERFKNKSGDDESEEGVGKGGKRSRRVKKNDQFGVGDLNGI